MSQKPAETATGERAGFHPHFLTTTVEFPTPHADIAEDLVQLDGSPSSTTPTSP